jgi:hypothetical protein
MRKLVQHESLTNSDRQTLWQAYAKHELSEIEWCKELAKNRYHGKQKAIAELLGCGENEINLRTGVGKAASEKLDNIKLLPSGYRTLYDLSRLDRAEIEELCSGDHPPTQEDIREYKNKKKGHITPKKPKTKSKKPTSDDEEYISDQLAMLVPAKLLKFPDFIIRSLEKEAALLRELIEQANRKTAKELLTLFVRILHYQHKVFQSNVQSAVGRATRAKEKELAARERDIERRYRAALSIKERVPLKEIKYVMGVLHPDREVSAARRAKAFDMVRKWDS